jgi:hypothetical protein
VLFEFALFNPRAVRGKKTFATSVPEAKKAGKRYLYKGFVQSVTGTAGARIRES